MYLPILSNPLVPFQYPPTTPQYEFQVCKETLTVHKLERIMQWDLEPKKEENVEVRI